jgi:ribonuclease HII
MYNENMERKGIIAKPLKTTPDYEWTRYAEYGLVAGIDEAGRGPLAGPVCVAAVIMPKSDIIAGVDDSKRLSERERERLYPLIISRAVAYSAVFIDNRVIDEINILEATRLGMERAAAGLAVRPQIILIDAVTKVKTDVPNVSIVRGDSLSYNIAAASVIAKVTRDRLMREYDMQYPQYAFARHKGYGTKAHIAAIKEFGACELHRRTFIKNFVN